jgi:hypothetical protein
MSTTSTAPEPAATAPEGPTSSSALGDTTRTSLLRSRRTAAVVGLVLLTALLLAWFGQGSTRGFLDPDAYDDAGSKAAAQLLRGQGIDVIRVTSTDAAVDALAGPTDATLLIAVPDLLQPPQVQALTQAAPESVVLVAPSNPVAIDGFTSATAGSSAQVATDVVDERVSAPACTWPVAARAGSADAGGALYGVEGQQASVTVQACYPSGDLASVLRLEGQSALTFVGDPRVLQNDRLAREGNASLALGTLGEHPRVVWYLPSYAELAAGQQSFLDLAPQWVPWVALQLVVVVLCLAAWRIRRVGPVVAEPLPSVVPATETVEGRGRLYRSIGARDRAAAALRAGTCERLGRRLGLPRTASPTTIADDVANRTGRDPQLVRALLAGPTPSDDVALARLGQDLITLEKELS